MGEFGEVIQFIDGWCWGISSDLKTIYLGEKTEVNEMLETGKRTGNKIIDDVLDLESQLSKEGKNGKEDTGRGVIRSKSPRAFQYRKAVVRQPQIK